MRPACAIPGSGKRQTVIQREEKEKKMKEKRRIKRKKERREGAREEGRGKKDSYNFAECTKGADQSTP